MNLNHDHRADAAAGETPVKKEKTDYIINKVIQALDILEQFHDDVDELSPTELSRRLAINEAHIHLLLATLKSRNYIELNNATQNYRLGFKNLELAQTVLRQTDLYRVSHPILADIAGKCGETTAVAVLRKAHVIELDAVQSEQPVQVMPRVGVHLPVHCTAAGKVLIAHASPESLELLFRGETLGRYTPSTVTDLQELKIHLTGIAEAGYAIDDQELDREVRGVAAAIHDYGGRVVGAVAITAPSCRVDLACLRDELAPLVLQGAREISAKLGYHLSEGNGGVIPEARRSAPRGVRTRKPRAA